MCNVYVDHTWSVALLDILRALTTSQGGDLTAGTQALPVGKIIKAKVLRKDSREIVQT